MDDMAVCYCTVSTFLHFESKGFRFFYILKFNDVFVIEYATMVIIAHWKLKIADADIALSLKLFHLYSILFRFLALQIIIL